MKPFHRGRKTQYRTEVRIRTNGPSFSLSFFSPYAGQANSYVEQMAPGSRGLFTGKAKVFNGSWQLEQPHQLMFGDDDGEDATLSKLLPVYPLTNKLYVWDLIKVIRVALDLVTDVPDMLTPELRERYDVVDVMTALRLVHGPDDYAQAGARAKTLPLRGGAGAPARARPATCGPARPGRAVARWRRAGCWRRSTSGCRSRSPPASARSARCSRPSSRRRTR